eukprot:TRINITY_DN9508_c0_g1_i1.p1 TRINITY_DN9508_c0_g1~~TRINITY_DN9508_c0_g1_i1.p1  ORF type:complete len:470 (-),score=104.45 TRINITY_DN9508_c0_g1_i1:78-1487(-)
MENETVLIQFKNLDQEDTGSQLQVPKNVTTAQLETLINHVLQNEEPLPYSFFLNDEEITSDLATMIAEQKISTEEGMNIVYQPQAVFRVRTVTRCTSSLTGHTDAVLSVQFSPNGMQIASGSGDSTLRIWDSDTQLPIHTCKGHKQWVMIVSWAPSGKKIASGGLDNEVRVWDPVSGKQIGGALKGHKRHITCLAWEPLHKNPDCGSLVSGSKDGSIKIWNLRNMSCVYSLTSHTMSITCVKWGGEDLIYSSSEDRTIKCWNPQGVLCRTLEGHAHWVNSITLNSDAILRKGPFDHTSTEPTSKEHAQELAQKHYDEFMNGVGKKELMVSGSDDFTMFMWQPKIEKKPITRMSGHVQLINHVSFSPNGQLVASGSFDKSIKLWNGMTGKFIANLRNHVQAIYQISWSADSRMLVSASKDSTLKVWDTKTHKMKMELPGHEDEVYAVDWSPEGQKVVSGSKDRMLKIWAH